MRIIFLIFILAVFGCKDAIKNESLSKGIAENINFDEPKVNNNILVNHKADLLGYWVGTFESDITEEETKEIQKTDSFFWYNTNKKITFSIDTIKGDSIIGHSIVGGNIRSFKGNCIENSASYNITVNEPGDNRYDGKFSLYIMKNDSIMNGGWIANSKINVPIHHRKIELQKKFFIYNPNNDLEDGYVDSSKTKKGKVSEEFEDSLGNFIEKEVEGEKFFTTTDTIFDLNPSKKLFKKELVENLSKGDIYILRNLIFARHGFAFRDRKLREYFDNHSWYMPVYRDIKNSLTAIEKKNIDLLLRYEQNAKEYYDTFGR